MTAKAAQPELAALIGHGRRRLRLRPAKAREKPQCDHGNAGAQIGQGEFRQQRNGSAAGLAEIAADTDGAVEIGVDDGAGVEAVRGQRIVGLALRTGGRAMPVRVGELIEILQRRSGERV